MNCGRLSNDRVYKINFCNRPFNKFDTHCREWYLSRNSDDNEIRVLDENIKEYFEKT